MSLIGRIVQVSVSRGGIPKLAVAEAWAGPLGLECDAHRNTSVHGGPLKAILLMSIESIGKLRGLGFDVSPGALGENLTVEGIDFANLRAGMRFRAGGAVVELTRLRTPCSNLDAFQSGGRRIHDYLYDDRAKAGDPSSPCWAMGGFYASVLAPGLIRAGDILELTEAAV